MLEAASLQIRPLRDDDPAPMVVAFQSIGWKKTEALYGRYLDLGGHPKPAINRQLKTGHSL
jgi:hypothetical protein